MMKALFSYSGYYIVLLLVFLWAFVLFKDLIYKVNIRKLVRPYLAGLVLSFLITAVIFISVKPAMRVLGDETDLLAVSKSMTYERRADNITMGKWYYDGFHIIARETPKRPLVFPFLTHLVHVVLGYRPDNVFVLNFLILFSLLSLLYAVFKRRLGTVWAASMVILVVSQPIVSLVATSGGFDLLSCLFWVISFVCLEAFLGKPSDKRFHLLWLSLLMLANIRYEGIMVFVIAVSFLACRGYLKAGFFKSRGYIYACTPLILLPTFWQRILTMGESVSEAAVPQAPFSLRYFLENNLIALKTLLDQGFYFPYAPIVNMIALPALIYFAILFIRGRIAAERPKRDFILVASACLIANWTLFTSFYIGRMDHPALSRLYLIFAILFSIMAGLAVYRTKIFERQKANFLFLTVIIFILYHPIAVIDSFSKTLTAAREHRFILDFLNKENGGGRNFLIITKDPGRLAALYYGAVDFEYANKDEAIIQELRTYLYRNIYVVQHIDYRISQPTADTKLKADYSLEKLAETQIDTNYYARISRVASRPYY